VRNGVEEGALGCHSLDIEVNSYAGTGVQAQDSVREVLDTGANGIITALPNSLQTLELVRDAKQKGVPVICVSTDVPESARLTAVTAHPFTCGAMAAEILGDYAKQRSS